MAIENLDPVIHERTRLAIMSLLAASRALTFTEVKEELKLTDGNLSVHLRTLEEKGFVSIEKRFVLRRPQTRVQLTAAGRKAFSQYVYQLEAVLKGKP